MVSGCNAAAPRHAGLVLGQRCEQPKRWAAARTKQEERPALGSHRPPEPALDLGAAKLRIDRQGALKRAAVEPLRERKADDLWTCSARSPRDDRSPARDQFEERPCGDHRPIRAKERRQSADFRDCLIIDFGRREPNQFHVFGHERPCIPTWEMQT